MGKAFPDNGSGSSSGPVQATVNEAFRQTKRVVIAVLGGTVLLVGVVMIVTPGPAVVMIPLGLAILAIEFAWARRLLKRVRDKLPDRVASSADKKGPAGEPADQADPAEDRAAERPT